MSEIHEVFPYLVVRDAKVAIAFYQQAFGATELFRLVEPSGRIGHVELKLGPAVLMVCDEFPEYGMLGPQGATSPAARSTFMWTTPTRWPNARSRPGPSC